MIEAIDVKRRLKSIIESVNDKNKDTRATQHEKAMQQFGQLQNAVIEDISKTGDQRTRQLLRMLVNFRISE